MKSLFLIIPMMVLSLLSMAQNGRVKIYFAGFVCDRETWDDAMQLDGKGDEIFLNFQFSLAGSAGNIKQSFEYKTPTYGDAGGQFSNRVNTGSCVDMFGNNRGGIKAGDRYIANDVIAEFDMDGRDVLTVIPTIWEWDPAQDVVNPVLNKLKGMAGDINRETSKIFASPDGTTSPVISTIGDVSRFIFPLTNLFSADFYATVQSVIGQQGTRPIGISGTGNFVPNVVVLTPQAMNNFMNTNVGFGNGVFTVRYFEEELGNTREHGNYLILLRAEYTPSPVNATVVAPSSSTIQAPSVTQPQQVSSPTQVTAPRTISPEKTVKALPRPIR